MLGLPISDSCFLSKNETKFNVNLTMRADVPAQVAAVLEHLAANVTLIHPFMLPKLLD